MTINITDIDRAVTALYFVGLDAVFSYLMVHSKAVFPMFLLFIFLLKRAGVGLVAMNGYYREW